MVGESRDSPNFWSTPIISGTDKATNFKFGKYIHRVRPNKSPLKFSEKMERGRIQGLHKFFEYPLLSQERVKLRTSNFVRTFLVSIGTKVHYNIYNSGRVVGCVVRTLKTFQCNPYIGRIARSSLR